MGDLETRLEDRGVGFLGWFTLFLAGLLGFHLVFVREYQVGFAVEDGGDRRRRPLEGFGTLEVALGWIFSAGGEGLWRFGERCFIIYLLAPNWPIHGKKSFEKIDGFLSD